MHPILSFGIGFRGGIEEGNSVAAPAASRRPSAERNPTHADFVVMNGAPGSWATRQVLTD